MAYNVKPVIIIVGGGFGGLEAAFQLRHRLGDAVHICLISERDSFYYSPGMMGIPFGAREEDLSFPLAPALKKANISFVRTRVESIDAVEKRVLAHNYQASYDFLVIATGARPIADELPGLNRYALSLYSDSELRRLRGELDRLKRHNRPQHLAVVIPPDFPCPGPLYQITAMLDAWFRRNKMRHRITLSLITAEHNLFQELGLPMHTAISVYFQKQEIYTHADCTVVAFGDGRIDLESGKSLHADLILSAPPLEAALQLSDLPVDKHGFLHADFESRRVQGFADVFVAGDASDLRLKQSQLAIQQGETVARQIYERLLGQRPIARFQPEIHCVLDRMNDGLYAVMRLQSTPDAGIAPGRLRIGENKIWRFYKKILQIVIVKRYRSGKPVLAGWFGQMVEAVTRMLASLTTR